MKANLLMGLSALACASIFSSCVSVSSLQTARTTEKGEIGWGVSASAVSFDDQGVLDTLGSDQDVYLPLSEVSVRYGVTDKLDVGLKLGVIGLTTLDAKYMLVGDHESPFALSAGASFGFVTVSSGDLRTGIYDIAVPVYASYHPAEWLAVYATPRYNLRLFQGTETVPVSFLGTSAGVRIGKRFGVVAEYSYMANLSGGAAHQQYSAGIVLGIN